MDREITVALAGDVMLGRLMNGVLNAFGPTYPWGNVIELLRHADLSIANLECVIAVDGVPWQRTPKVFHFRADPVGIDALIVAGIDAVTLANNHVLDFEEPALLEMLGRLDTAGISRAGAGRDIDEASRPAIVEAGGLRLALISFTDNEPGWAAAPSRPGVNYLPADVGDPSLDRLKMSIAAVRSNADIVLCCPHWGPNMRLRPSPAFRDFAHALVDAGADIIGGHSAHVFQGVELYRGKPIIYDLGDFVDDYAVDPELRNDWALLYLFKVTEKGICDVEAVPLLIDRYQVNLAPGPDARGIAVRLRDLSAEFGTTIVFEAGRLKLGGVIGHDAAA